MLNSWAGLAIATRLDPAPERLAPACTAFGFAVCLDVLQLLCVQTATLRPAVSWAIIVAVPLGGALNVDGAGQRFDNVWTKFAFKRTRAA